VTRVPVSVIVGIINEAQNLPRCLKSVSWADEIFVVDSNSTDGSAAIAQSFGAKVVQFKFNGIWPKKTNWSLDNLPFSHEWVFILDADEVLPPEAEAEIREVCTTNTRGFDGYFINRRFYFMGKWLRHAYHPNWVMRLFKHRLGRYEKLTDIPAYAGDFEAHEPMIINGKTGYLRVCEDHYAFPTVEAFVEKHNRYSNWAARVAISGYAKRILNTKHISWWRRLKILAIYLPFRPLLRFLYVYIVQKGFLDGREGFYFARLHAFYEFLCISKTYELKKTLRNK
jgi:glycosyltransferase involved in cell wall biosynthesis